MRIFFKWCWPCIHTDCRGTSGCLHYASPVCESWISPCFWICIHMNCRDIWWWVSCPWDSAVDSQRLRLREHWIVSIIKYNNRIEIVQGGHSCPSLSLSLQCLFPVAWWSHWLQEYLIFSEYESSDPQIRMLICFFRLPFPVAWWSHWLLEYLIFSCSDWIWIFDWRGLKAETCRTF